jgi:hypothetical protein
MPQDLNATSADPPLPVVMPQVKGDAWLVRCPYCAAVHRHGPAPGERVAHCHSGDYVMLEPPRAVTPPPPNDGRWSIHLEWSGSAGYTFCPADDDLAEQPPTRFEVTPPSASADRATWARFSTALLAAQQMATVDA